MQCAVLTILHALHALRPPWPPMVRWVWLTGKDDACGKEGACTYYSSMPYFRQKPLLVYPAIFYESHAVMCVPFQGELGFQCRIAKTGLYQFSGHDCQGDKSSVWGVIEESNGDFLFKGAIFSDCWSKVMSKQKPTSWWRPANVGRKNRSLAARERERGSVGARESPKSSGERESESECIEEGEKREREWAENFLGVRAPFGFAGAPFCMM